MSDTIVDVNDYYTSSKYRLLLPPRLYTILSLTSTCPGEVRSRPNVREERERGWDWNGREREAERERQGREAGERGRDYGKGGTLNLQLTGPQRNKTQGRDKARR